MAEPPPEVLYAWREYLEATISLPASRYEEIEPWAWERLRRRLERARKGRG